MHCPECSTEFKGNACWITGIGSARVCPSCGHEFKEPTRLRKTARQIYSEAFLAGMEKAKRVIVENFPLGKESPEWHIQQEINRMHKMTRVK